MLGVGNTGVGAASSLALDVRVAVGAGVFAAGNATTTSAPTQSSAASQKVLPTYNAFQFVYRPDYGKVILLWENAETGQEVNQVPSEYHLQQYAATQRAQRQQQLAKLDSGSTTRSTGSVTTGRRASGGTGSVGVAPAVTPSAGAAVQAAPAPAAAVGPAPAAAAPVDIKV